MAIIKSVAKASKSKTGAKVVLDYVAKKAEFTYGINCSEDYKLANKEFQETKEFYNKLEGRQYKHIVQSFKEGEVDKEQALKIGVEFCKKAFPKYEVFIATHTDRNHIHNHIVLNSVSLETGEKYHEKNSDLRRLKELNNDICKENGLKIPEKSKEQGKVVIWNQSSYMAVKKGILKEKESDSLKLVNTILKVASQSNDRTQFIDLMKKQNYSVEWSNEKKHVVFTVGKDILNGTKDKFRLETLHKNFNHIALSKEGLENEFSRTRSRENRTNISRGERATDTGIKIKYKDTSEFIREFEKGRDRKGNSDTSSKEIYREIEFINNRSPRRDTEDIQITSIADSRTKERKQREYIKEQERVRGRKSKTRDFGIGD